MNKKAEVTFRFVTAPEYLRVGSTIVFRESATKGIGEVTKVYPFDPENPSLSSCRRKLNAVSPPGSPTRTRTSVPHYSC